MHAELPRRHRTARRLRSYEIKLPVTFDWRTAARAGESIELSAHGMRVKIGGVGDLGVRTNLTLTIHVAKAELRLRAQVTLCSPDEIEVEFCESPGVVRSYFRNVICSLYPLSLQAARLHAEEQGPAPKYPMLARPNRVSIVVPLYNEEHGLETFHAELTRALAGFDDELEWEIIYVDDGSSDRTLELLSQISNACSDVRVYSLSRNFGHQAALMAGMESSTGIAVITMDGDLQHPPSVVPQLIEKWQQGHDIVQTLRTSAANLGFVKKATSLMFYRIFDWLSALKLRAGAADFRLLDRHVVDSITSLSERNLFLRGISQWVGFHTAYVEYDAPQRIKGVSQFSFKKMLSLAADGIFAFSVFPLRIAMYLGLISLGLTFLVVLYVAQAKVRHVSVPGWASLLLVSSLFSGLQLLVLGVVAEYLGRVFSETKRRPRYLIKELVGVEDPVFVSLSEVLSADGA